MTQTWRDVVDDADDDLALVVAPHTPSGLTSKTALAQEAVTWTAKARAITIVDAASCVHASQLLRSVKGLRTEVQQWFAPHVEAAMETKRTAEAARKALVTEQTRMEAPLLEAETLLKRSLLAWETAQARLRSAQECALQADAQRLADAQTLEAAAALEREAQATGNAEMLQEAHDILSQPMDTPVVSVASLMPKVDGITYRDAWKIHADIDVPALAGAVASRSVPMTFVTPNVVALNAFARATQGTQPVPGVRFVNDRQIAVKG